MHKMLAYFLSLIFIFSLVSCKEKENKSESVQEIKMDQPIGTCGPKQSGPEEQSCKAK
jgi:hypothetical protein